MISRTFTFLVGAACVAMLSAAQTPAQDKQTEYYPLQVGRWWRYKVDSQNVVVRVDRTEEVEMKKIVFDEKKQPKDTKLKALGYVLESSSDDRKQTETVVVLEDGVYRTSAAGKDISPPICFLKLPPRPGEKWQVESKSEGMPVQGTFTTQLEEIELVAFKGKHRAFKSTSENFQMGKHQMKLSYWFLSGVGLVKQHLQVGNFDVTMELEKYQPVK